MKFYFFSLIVSLIIVTSAGAQCPPDVPGETLWHRIDQLGICLINVVESRADNTCSCVDSTLLSVSDVLTALLTTILVAIGG